MTGHRWIFVTAMFRSGCGARMIRAAIPPRERGERRDLDDEPAGHPDAQVRSQRFHRDIIKAYRASLSDAGTPTQSRRLGPNMVLHYTHVMCQKRKAPTRTDGVTGIAIGLDHRAMIVPCPPP